MITYYGNVGRFSINKEAGFSVGCLREVMPASGGNAAGSYLFPRQVSAQAPDKMSYQAVIRDASGNLVTEQEVGMQISIIQGSTFGASVYIETQTPVTNANGLVTIVIGNGEVVHGTFSGIDWSDGPYFIKTETDTSGGTTYTIAGTSQLLSVPYAIYAKTAATVSEPIVESDPVFESRPASNIDAADISSWDEAYSWGDHADKGYLITETDPLFTDSPASGIEVNDIDNWNEAYDITSSTLTVNRGGTGRSSLTSGKLLVGSGTSEVLMPANLHWNNANARLGIGTSSPLEGLHVSDANFAVTGTHGISPAISITGAGTRMFFYARKSAFRAGRVTLEEWNDENIGNYSTAMGYNSTASELGSIAMGYETIANGSASIAMGRGTTASGISSTAMGRNANAVGHYSFAINLSTGTGPDVPANRFQISGASAIGGNQAWSNFSDKRLKKDIQDLGRENNLEKIMKLNGVRFRWEDSNPGNDRFYIGFLAQDVLDILPEPVLHDELNDIYSMEYSAIIPVLVEAIKEQQALIENQLLIIEGLEEKVESVVRENALLGSSLNALEQLRADFEFWKSIVQANPGE